MAKPGSIDSRRSVAHPPAALRGEIRTLQDGRGLAALMVALFHADTSAAK